MPTCPQCSEENPERARFCLACGTALDGKKPTPQEERRVISVVFVDLVGFTARSDKQDPEDVQADRRSAEAARRVLDHLINEVFSSTTGEPQNHVTDLGKHFPIIGKKTSRGNYC